MVLIYTAFQKGTAELARLIFLAVAHRPLQAWLAEGIGRYLPLGKARCE